MNDNLYQDNNLDQDYATEPSEYDTMFDNHKISRTHNHEEMKLEDILCDIFSVFNTVSIKTLEEYAAMIGHYHIKKCVNDCIRDGYFVLDPTGSFLSFIDGVDIKSVLSFDMYVKLSAKPSFGEYSISKLPFSYYFKDGDDILHYIMVINENDARPFDMLNLFKFSSQNWENQDVIIVLNSDVAVHASYFPLGIKFKIVHYYEEYTAHDTSENSKKIRTFSYEISDDFFFTEEEEKLKAKRFLERDVLL